MMTPKEAMRLGKNPITEMQSITLRLDGLKEPLQARINLMHEEAAKLVEEQFSQADAARMIEKEVKQHMQYAVADYVRMLVKDFVESKDEEIRKIVNGHLDPAYYAAIKAAGKVLVGTDSDD